MEESQEYSFSESETALVTQYEQAIQSATDRLAGAIQMIAASHGRTGDLDRVGYKLVKKASPAQETRTLKVERKGA